MSNRIVAIHQPNFFPWLGYFDKIRRADVFIFLDNVKFSRGTRVNRVNLLMNGAPHWLTCPVRRKSGLQIINQVLISENTDWRGKHWTTITQNYRKCPGWEENAPCLKELLMYPKSNLAQYNIHAISTLCTRLGINAEFVVASELGEFEEKATDLLIAIIKQVGGDVYLSGDGAGGYQIDERFAECGVGLLYQNFQHPVYEQRGAETFVPGLSIVDVILNCGLEATTRLLEGASGE